MQEKYKNKDYLYTGEVKKCVNACEADQLEGSVAFTCEGQSEEAIFDVGSCLRVSANMPNLISRIQIPVGSKVSFRIKTHRGVFLKCYDLQKIS